MTARLALQAPSVAPRSVDLILLALAAALAPHLLRLPPGLALFCLVFGLWRWMAAHYDWSLPGAVVRTLLTVTALAGVFAAYGTVFGRDAGTALLAIMLGLKLLELQRFRDAVVILFLGYFLAVTTALYTQSLPLVAYMLLVLTAITAALIDLNHLDTPHPPLGRLARRAGALLGQALPLALIMFLLFPRIPGPLWNLPKDAYGGMTGLDDSMTPGSISELGQSDAVAFRVAFEGKVPSQPLLYWRGPVFWYTDGRSWSPGSGTLPAADGAFQPLGAPVRYTVTLEPHNRRWLYALDLPLDAPAQAQRTADLFLAADAPVRRLTRYTVDSYLRYRTSELDPAERARALELPAANPRARRLGAGWRGEIGREAGSDQRIVQRALTYFRDQPFFYTLKPPPLDDDPVDAFLFDTRRGFCEHYASAFTVLMRAAGIPARVVTGYQGGELNTVGDYLIVRQRDAHAWAEVWLEGRGWVRMDPTAAVAPERIEQGMEALESRKSSLFGTLQSDSLASLWRQVRFGWDTINTRWSQWVLAYGPSNQQALLSFFGLRSWIGMAVAMAAGLFLVLLALGLVVLLRRQRRRDPVATLYRRFCTKLRGCGIERAPAEGPLDFAARVAHLRPELAGAADSISRLYIGMRYGGRYPGKDIVRLRREIAAFRP